ncbi:hypothetical protein ACQP00_40115 [Dactylosporangium sp. CS-047395]|uniref:hypothetical protein n=1 Tax=Dactylosporangium sp. CS-047395 TaxID=3239936 RepID=UPI003D8F388D
MSQPYEHYEVSPVGEEYTGQYPPQQPYSAVPYAQPYSAPPQQQPYQQPAYQPAPFQPPPPPRRSSGLIALIASLAVLAVVAVAVVVVVVVRGKGDEPPVASVPATTAASPAATANAQVGPVDSCLIGNWKQSQYSALFDLSDVTIGGKPLGQVNLSGGGRTWKITVDGKGVEDFSQTKYSGQTADGHKVDATFTGANQWELKTANHEILFTSTGSDVQMTVAVDGKATAPEKVEPHNNPQPYECGSNQWTAKSLTDANAGTVYKRV